jgi:hypothetical protein
MPSFGLAMFILSRMYLCLYTLTLARENRLAVTSGHISLCFLFYVGLNLQGISSTTMLVPRVLLTIFWRFLSTVLVLISATRPVHQALWGGLGSSEFARGCSRMWGPTHQRWGIWMHQIQMSMVGLLWLLVKLWQVYHVLREMMLTLWSRLFIMHQRTVYMPQTVWFLFLIRLELYHSLRQKREITT